MAVTRLKTDGDGTEGTALTVRTSASHQQNLRNGFHCFHDLLTSSEKSSRKDRAPDNPLRLLLMMTTSFIVPHKRDKKKILTLFSKQGGRRSWVVYQMRSGIGQPGVAFIFLGQEVQCPEGYLPGPNLPLGWTFLLLWFPTSVISSFSATIVSGFRFTNLLSPAGNFLVIDGTTCNINLLPLKSVCLHGRGYYVSQRNASQTHKSLKAKQKSKQTALQREHYPAGPFKSPAMSVTAQGRGRHCTFTNQSLLLSSGLVPPGQNSFMPVDGASAARPLRRCLFEWRCSS